MGTRRSLRRVLYGLVFFGRVNLPAKKHEIDLQSQIRAEAGTVPYRPPHIITTPCPVGSSMIGLPSRPKMRSASSFCSR